MSHQDRREPLDRAYQFPTHGVDCDCPPCRERITADPFYQRWITPEPLIVDVPQLMVLETDFWGV